MDIKGETNRNKLIIGDFNTPLTSIDRSSRHIITKASEILNGKIEQSDLIDVFRTWYLKNAKYTIFSGAHRKFSKIDCILGHKTSLNKFKRVKVTQTVFSDHNGIN